MKFQPGQVVHVVHFGKGIVISSIITHAIASVNGRLWYSINGSDLQWEESEFFATFDNAMAELKRQSKEGK